MNFLDLVAARHSSRAFHSDKPVAWELIEQVLHAANRCPTAGNLQAYEIFVVTKQEHRDELAKICYNQAFIAQAPVALIFMTNADRSRETYGDMADKVFAYQDATIACAYAELAVTELGMSSCWIGGGVEAKIHELTGAPESWKTNSILVFGYPADCPEPTTRRNLADIYTEL